jgi:hypothetical protein
MAPHVNKKEKNEVELMVGEHTLLGNNRTHASFSEPDANHNI